ERRVVLGYFAMAKGNYTAARQELEKAVSMEPGRAEAWHALAEAAWERGTRTSPLKEKEAVCRRAEEVLGRALKVDRGYLPFWLDRAARRLDLALCLGDTGKDATISYQGAEDDYTQAIRLQPSVAAYVGRAQVRTLQATHRTSLGENPQKGFEESAADLE